MTTALATLSDQSDMPAWTGWTILIIVGVILLGTVGPLVILSLVASFHKRSARRMEESMGLQPNKKACSFLTCDNEATCRIQGWPLCLEHAENYINLTPKDR